MKNITRKFNSDRAVFFLMVFICIIIGAAVLKIAAIVILPFIIAVLLAFVMYPIVKGLDKKRCPRILSILLVIIIGLSLFGAVFFTSGMMIVEQFPQYEDRLKILYDWAADFFILPYDEALTIWKNLWDQAAIRIFVRDFTLSFSNIVFRFISSAGLVMLFMVFILLEASYFTEKLEAAFEKHSIRINKMGNDLMSQITRYLTAKFFSHLLTV